MNLKLQVEENKQKCAEHTTSLAERINNPDHHIALDGNGDLVIPGGDRDDPKLNEQIIEEFGQPINDPSLQEADQDFTSDAYHDDTYLNMELALPRDGADVQIGRVVKMLAKRQRWATNRNSPRQINPRLDHGVQG